MAKVVEIHGREILDSRGMPTVEVEVRLECGRSACASVPSGASTGTHEAVELRDGEAGRYLGRGVRTAVGNVDKIISPALMGLDPLDQRLIDGTLIDLDGTAQKKRLGANAMLAVSLAVARAAAMSLDLPLWRYLGGPGVHLMPLPLLNVVNGGAHANNNLEIQEFMIIPHGADSFAEALRMGAETYQALKKKLAGLGRSTGVGDEGGFSAGFSGHDEALDLLVDAICAAGFTAGEDISIGLDVAASELTAEGGYLFGNGRQVSGAEELIAIYEDLCRRYPIISLEDGLAEDDWQGWVSLTTRLGGKIQLVGDDLFVTNGVRLRTGMDIGAANAVLVKPNQIGTLTETLDVIDQARRGGYNTIISHRSGETDDSFIADLAVATGAGQIKCGAPRGMDRLSKYNRLLSIEEALGGRSAFAGACAAAPRK